MSDTINTGGDAFPSVVHEHWKEHNHGMSLRDYFAAEAMVGIISDPEVVYNGPDNESGFGMWAQVIARQAYQFADAMLKAREGK